MAKLYSQELTGPLATIPARKAKGSRVGGRMRRYSATIPLSGQTTADTIVTARVPRGSAFAFGIFNATVSLGTSTIAVGVAGDSGKYRAAATLTATTPTLFGADAPVADGGELAEEEEIFITIGAASLPGSGTLVVDLYFSHG